MSFDGKELVIRGRGMWRRGERVIPLSSISAIQFHRPGILHNGYVQFISPGTTDLNGSTKKAVSDESAVVVAKDQVAAFESFIAEVRAAMRGESPSAMPSAAAQDAQTAATTPTGGGVALHREAPARAVRKGFGRRLLGGLGWAAGVVIVLAFIGSKLPQPTDQAATAERNRQAEARPSPEALKAFKAIRDQLPVLAKPCDAALAQAARAHGQVRSYSAALRAEKACRDAANAMLNLHHEAPIPGPARDDLDKALQCYGFAYGQRANAMGQAKEIVDGGDDRPSQVATFRANLSDALARTKECGVIYADAQLKHGFEAEALKGVLGPS